MQLSEPFLLFPLLALLTLLATLLLGRLLSSPRLFLLALLGPAAGFVLVPILSAIAGERELLGASPTQLFIFLGASISGGALLALLRRERAS
jgi:hypothetical protein